MGPVPVEGVDALGNDPAKEKRRGNLFVSPPPVEEIECCVQPITTAAAQPRLRRLRLQRRQWRK
jgi:hypothetical protein